MAWPRIGGPETLWMNGLYEALCIVAVFPFVVWLGASAQVSARTGRVCAALGGLSYPLYIIHYPFVYTYTAWTNANHVSLRDGLPVAALTFVVCVALAWLLLKYYDEPVRAWLTRRWMGRKPALAAPAANR
jgi:peptidoglycan/LPS O-acetylase OafA/YrhL